MPRSVRLPERDQVTDDTPLHLVAWDGNTDMARALVEAGADVNARDNKGTTAAAYALRNQKAECAAYLKSKGGVE